MKQSGWWSRPRTVRPCGLRGTACGRTRRPRRPASRRAGRAASGRVIRAATGLSIVAGTSSSGRRRCPRRGRCRGSPSPSRRAARTARPARPAGGRAGSCWRSSPRPGWRRRSSSDRAAAPGEMSITSGTAVCMRKASSYWAMRVSVSGWPSSCGLHLVQVAQGVEAEAAHVAVHALRGRTTYSTGSPCDAALHALEDRRAESRCPRRSCRRSGRCRWRSSTTKPGRFSVPSPGRRSPTSPSTPPAMASRCTAAARPGRG